MVNLLGLLGAVVGLLLGGVHDAKGPQEAQVQVRRRALGLGRRRGGALAL